MGVAAPLGAVTGAVAATMALGADLPPGLVVLGDERLATADLLRDVDRRGRRRPPVRRHGQPDLVVTLVVIL